MPSGTQKEKAVDQATLDFLDDTDDPTAAGHKLLAELGGARDFSSLELFQKLERRHGDANAFVAGFL